MAAMGEVQGGLRGVQQEATKSQSGFMGLGKVVPVVAVVAAAVLGFAAVTTKMASDFEASMRQVQTQGGVTEAQMESMKGRVLQVSKETGQSAVDLANALMPIAAVGYKHADAINVLKAAAIGAKTFHA